MTTAQLLKLFFFPDWLKYQVEAGHFVNEKDAIEYELSIFAEKEFTLRDDFKGPAFMPIMLPDPYTLGGFNLNITRKSITDIGLCETVNGYSMKETYKVNSKRMEDFVRVLDNRREEDQDTLGKILGSGSLFKTDMYLNVRDPLCADTCKGKIWAALNSRRDYFSVKSKVS